MKLIYVRAARSRGYITLGISDGTENKYAYTLSEIDYAEIGSPLSGATLDSGALEVIRECDERYRATLTALRILAYGDNSQRNLYNKLTSRGISKEIASATVSDMLSQGYMDEARQMAAERGIPVCDCYAEWKRMAAEGRDTTVMLCNYINHPTREMHKLFADKLFETIFGFPYSAESSEAESGMYQKS